MKHLCLSLLIPVLVAGCGSTSTSAPETAGDSGVESERSEINTAVPFTNKFDHSLITEASGLQRSLRSAGVYYTHNDSGGDPMLFVTDVHGHDLGTLMLNGIAAVDWEAIGAARIDGEATLVVADIGDNSRQRQNLRLLVVTEPDIAALPAGFEQAVNFSTIAVSYADGLSYDAESVFIDGDNDTVAVVTKNMENAALQALWKGSLASGLSEGRLVLEYRGLIALQDDGRANAVTDIDIHPNGRELAVLTYGPLSTGRVHLWQAQAGEGTADALTRPADRVIQVPLIGTNIQAEGISYSSDGEYLLIGAESISISTITVVPVQ